MKVRCIRIIDEKNGQTRKDSPWLTVGKTYHVLSIFLDERKIFLIRMIGDDGVTPALFGLNQFAVVSNKLPSCWAVDWNPDGIFEIAPAKWLVTGFWERYFNGEKDAIQIFEEERRKILEEE